MSDSFDTIQYKRSVSTTRTHGILAIVFGALGVLFGLPFMFLLLLAAFFSASLEDTVTATVYLVFTFVLFVIPHIYLIISGTQLLKEPTPKLARTLIIINLVVGVLSNLVILVISIVNLVQMSDYERGYPHHPKRHGK